MKLDSKILSTEEVDNKDRKFGSNLSYYPAYVVKVDGVEVPALFTKTQLEEAISRAEANPEDMPKQYKGLFSWLFS